MTIQEAIKTELPFKVQDWDRFAVISVTGEIVWKDSKNVVTLLDVDLVSDEWIVDDQITVTKSQFFAAAAEALKEQYDNKLYRAYDAESVIKKLWERLQK